MYQRRESAKRSGFKRDVMVAVNDVVGQGKSPFVSGRVGQTYLCDVVYEGDFIMVANGVIWQTPGKTYLCVVVYEIDFMIGPVASCGIESVKRTCVSCDEESASLPVEESW